MHELCLHKIRPDKSDQNCKMLPMSGCIQTCHFLDFFLLLLSELLFFYPVELGLGINSEVRKIEIYFIFNT